MKLVLIGFGFALKAAPAIADSRSTPLTLIRHGVGVTIIAFIRR